ncbi:hypothetical protein L580_2756 [Serratia fonticola AU-P3(3)]|nr:hypothetical protein L580_2756 [Serratia fonticola AU-P3(3)]
MPVFEVKNHLNSAITLECVDSDVRASCLSYSPIKRNAG